MGDRIANAGAEHGGLRDAVAAEAICAVDAARIFSRGEQSFEVGEAVTINANAAHVKMGGGRDFNPFASEIESDAQAAVAHPAKIFLHKRGPEMRDIDPDTAVFRAAPG